MVVAQLYMTGVDVFGKLQEIGFNMQTYWVIIQSDNRDVKGGTQILFVIATVQLNVKPV